MKIFNNKLNKYQLEVNNKNHSPSFGCKKIPLAVMNPNHWKTLSAATTIVGLASIAINSNKTETDYTQLREILRNQAIEWNTGANRQPIHTEEDIESIIESYKKNPKLVSQMISMVSKYPFAQEPRFSAKGIESVVFAAEKNPQLVNKLLYMGYVENNVIQKYSYSADEISSIVALATDAPEIVNKISSLVKQYPDKSFVPRFDYADDYSKIVKAYKKNPTVINDLINIEGLIAREIVEISEIFENKDFYNDLKTTLPKDYLFKTDNIKGFGQLTQLFKSDFKNLTINQKEYLNKYLSKLPKEIIDIYRKHFIDFDAKLSQLKMALGLYNENISSNPEKKISFIKNIIANNNTEVENVLKSFDFTQYGKDGLPLKYPRKEFINKINNLIKDLSPNEKNIILNHFGLMEGYDGYDGLLSNKPLDNPKLSKEAQTIAKEIKKEIDIFTLNNEVITGNKKADVVLTALIQGIGGYPFYVGKKQHNNHAYSIDIHTLKALQSAMNHPLYEELSDISKTILKTSILLHDIGKKGGVVDTGHESLSGTFAETILKDFSLTEDVKNRIIDTIYNHHWFAAYCNKALSPQEVAAYCRYPENLKIYEIFAKSDFENVSNDFHLQCTPGATNQAEFDNYIKKQIKPIYPLLDRIRSKSPLVFDTKFFLNGERFPRESAIIKGDLVKLKVLNFNKLADNASLQEYGFTTGVTKENARFLVHVPLNFEETYTLLKNRNNRPSISASCIKFLANNIAYNKNFGFILNSQQADISIAYKENLSIGCKRNFEDFKDLLLLEKNNPKNPFLYTKYKEKRVYLRDNLINELSKKRYNLSEAEYGKLADYIISKKYTTQITKDIKISDKIIKAEDLKNALETSLESLFNREQEINEVDCYSPTIQGLFARVEKLEDCPQEFLSFAAKYDLPIILMRPSD